MEEAENMLSLEFVTKVMGEGDKARFQGRKPEEVQALLEALVETGLEHVANDRENFFRSLLEKLDTCAKNLAILLEAAEHDDWVWPTEQIETVTKVYSVYTMLIYRGFMGNLTPEELRELKRLTAAVDEAWKALLGKIAESRPKLKEVCEMAQEDEERLSKRWSEVFTGERGPVFSADHRKAWREFTEDLYAIAEGL